MDDLAFDFDYPAPYSSLMNRSVIQILIEDSFRTARPSTFAGWLRSNQFAEQFCQNGPIMRQFVGNDEACL
jgi:hypothetical protein